MRRFHFQLVAFWEAKQYNNPRTETDNSMNMAQKLTTLRKEKGLTQMELAEVLDVSRQAVSKWELGTALPGTDKLKSIADLYGVSVDYLLDENQERYEPTIPLASSTPEGNGRDKLFLVMRTGILAVVIGMVIGFVVLMNGKVEKESLMDDTIPIKELTIVNIDEDTNPTMIWNNN